MVRIGSPLAVHPGFADASFRTTCGMRDWLLTTQSLSRQSLWCLDPLGGIRCLCSLAWSLASWDPCPVLYQVNILSNCAIILALVMVFRYSTQSYLLSIRRVNSHLIPGTRRESTSILFISHPESSHHSFLRGWLFQRKIHNKWIVPSWKSGCSGFEILQSRHVQVNQVLPRYSQALLSAVYRVSWTMYRTMECYIESCADSYYHVLWGVTRY